MMNSLWALALQETGEHADERSPLFLILPEPAELIWGAVSFLIVAVFVGRRAMPALKRTLEARQKAITGQLEEAEKSKQEAASLLDDYRKQVADAQTKGNEIIEEARRTAETMRSEMLARAQAEADQILARARDEASDEKNRALTEARQEVANLSVDLAEKVVGANLDRAAQLGLVERYLADLERM